MTFQETIEREGLKGRYQIYQVVGIKSLEDRADEIRSRLPALQVEAEGAKSSLKKAQAAAGTREAEVYADLEFAATNKEGRDAEFQVALKSDDVLSEFKKEISRREEKLRDADAEEDLLHREWTLVLEKIRNRRSFVNLLAGGNTGGTN